MERSAESGPLPVEPLAEAAPEADAAPVELPPFGEEQAAEPSATKARRPRRRARKPAPEEADTAEAAGTQEPSIPNAAAAEADAVTERPKRRRAPAKSKAKPEATEPRARSTARRTRRPAAGTDDGPTEPVAQSAAGNGEHLEAAADRPVEPAPQPLAASNLEQPDPDENDDRPKRRGWWQRWV